MRIGALPLVQRQEVDGKVYVYPPDGLGRSLAGPFDTSDAGRWWVVEHLESTLTPAQLEVWRAVVDLLPAERSRDGGLELGLLDIVRHGRTIEQLRKYIPRGAARSPQRTFGYDD